MTLEDPVLRSEEFEDPTLQARTLCRINYEATLEGLRSLKAVLYPQPRCLHFVLGLEWLHKLYSDKLKVIDKPLLDAVAIRLQQQDIKNKK